MLVLKNVISGYRENSPILKGVDLQISENETVGIIGQNGAGKSTLAKTIMSLVPYVSGEILFNGDSIVGKNTQEIVELGIGYFFQGGRVFPHLTVEENLAVAGTGLNKKELQNRRAELERYFDLLRNRNNDRLGLKASYLSGGEQHQLALAMVLMRQPKMLILDEPSAGLSPGNVKKLYEILFEIKNERKSSILLIEQNVNMALRFSDKTLLLKNGAIFEKKIDNVKSVFDEYFNNNLN